MGAELLHTSFRQQWTGERIARLGFLIGLGWDVYRIATDPIINTTVNNIYHQMQRFSLSFRTAAASIALDLPPAADSYFSTAADKRGLTRDMLIRKVLLEISGDVYLLDNILDDGV